MEEAENVFEDVGRIADCELIAGLRRMVGQHQALTARLLVHLGEVDSRGLYREHAFASMFAYAVEELHMSEAEAYLRIQAARLGRQYPIIIRMLAGGELHLTAIKLLGPHLTPGNHLQVLERARFKGKREIELIVAEFAPKPDVPSVVRKLPTPGPAQPADRATKPALAPAPQESLVAAADLRVEQCLHTEIAARPVDLAQPDRTLSSTLAPSATTEQAGREPFQLKSRPTCISQITPLSPGRYKVAFTAGQAMHDTLERLKDLLRHQVLDGDVAVILERAAELLLDKTLKDRFAQTRRPRRRAINLVATPTQARPQPSTPERTVRGASEQPTRQHEPAHPSRSATVSAERPPQTRSRRETPPPGAIVSSTDPAEPPLCSETRQRLARAQTDRETSPQSRLKAPGQSSRIASTRPEQSRYIPRAVVREVHARDGEQCTFVSADGRRCKARAFLELHHHDTPYAKGGQATVENLRLVCRAHNSWFADRDFGKPLMESKLARARKQKREATKRLGPNDSNCDPP